MDQKIIFINSKMFPECILDLIKNLKNKGLEPIIASNLKNQPGLDGFSVIKIFFPALNKKVSLLFLAVICPLAFWYWLSVLIKLKKQFQNPKIVLCQTAEKLIFTWPAKILGLKVFWLEFPETNPQKFSPLEKKLYKWKAKKADKIIIFSKFNQLAMERIGADPKKINLLHPGIAKEKAAHQDDIFHRLAEENQSFKRKFFTIGIICDLNRKPKIEGLFQAIKTALEVAGNIQLIIIGDGAERQGLQWLAKKMKIDNLVWFVGNQNRLQKWFGSFDVFILTSEQLSITDMIYALKAMSAKLPVIAPINIGLGEIIEQNKTGVLVELDNSEMLARNIIKLQQNENLKNMLGFNAKQRVDNLFTLDKMVEEFVSITQIYE